MPSFIDSLAKNIFQKATVIYKQQIAPYVYHIRIQDEALKDHHYIPGEHLRLFVGIDRGTALNSKLRTYSIWDHSSMQGTVDMAVCVHSSGIGATWAGEVSVGEAIHYMGPKGKLTIDFNADSGILISDPSALSHMYAIRRHIGSGKAAIGITYASDVSDYYADIDGSRPFRFIQADSDPSERIIQELDVLKDKLPGRPAIYIGGDARVCKSLSQYLRQSWPHATIASKGFWMPGKTGMD